MLISCGGRHRNKARDTEGERVPSHRQKIPRLGEPNLDDASGWEYVAEGGANVVFRHKDCDTSILRVPKSVKPTDHSKIFEFIKKAVLPTMNNVDIFPKLEDNPTAEDKLGCNKSESGGENHEMESHGHEEKYRSYGELVEPNNESFLNDLNMVLDSSERPSQRISDYIVRHSSTEPTWMMLLPNVIDTAEVCVELKPKSSLGPHNTNHPKRYDGMAMKQRTCRYCMHQEWKAHTKKIQKRRHIGKAYCPMDLFSKDRERMKMAIAALMDDPQNNFKVFRPDGKDITPEVVACTKVSSTATETSFENVTGMERDDFLDVIVEALSESCVLDDLHRAHELDELDIERIWALTQIINHYSDWDGSMKVKETLSSQKNIQNETKNLQLLFKIGCTGESDWDDARKRYQRALEKFLLATTMKDCSILLSIRRERSPIVESQQLNDKWSEMDYGIDCKGRSYRVLISIIDLDIKSESNVPKYYKLDQDIVHHYSETHGLHKRFCFGQSLFESNDSRSESQEPNDSIVQIRGNMMCRLLYPNPVCLLTVYDPSKHEANVMTITWLTAIDNHGMFVCSVSKRRHTSELLHVSSVFVLNIPTCELEETILAIGSCSGRDTDKFRQLGLPTCCPGWISGNQNQKKTNTKEARIMKHAIALRDCIAHTVCLVEQKQDMGHHWLLVCKQQLAWSKEAYFADGKRFQRSSDDLPPYLTFLGTKTFGSVV